MNIQTHSKSERAATRSQWAIRQGLGLWELTFGGQTAVLKHEQGVYYVAYLLLNPPTEPIHGLALALRTEAIYRPIPVAAEVAGSASGTTFVPEAGAVLQERSLGLEDAQAAWALRRKQRELEALLDDDNTTAPVKEEALRELEALYEFQRGHPWRAGDAAQKAAAAVGKALQRFHRRLAEAVDAFGRPHPVLRAFAAHLKNHLLIPSGRGCARGGPRPGSGRAGCFTYEPPAGVAWAG